MTQAAWIFNHESAEMAKKKSKDNLPEVDQDEYRAAVLVLFRLMKRDNIEVATIVREGNKADLSLTVKK